MRISKKKVIENSKNIFDKVHYIQKNRRSLESLFKILKYYSENYRAEIKNIQILLSKDKGYKVKIHDNDFVACSIAARSKKHGVFGTSHKLLDEKKYNKNLLNAINILGKIGEKSVYEPEKSIGKCAEVKAANNILNVEKKTQLSDIEFTAAIRPRTGETMKRCNNCIQVFGHE